MDERPGWDDQPVSTPALRSLQHARDRRALAGLFAAGVTTFALLYAPQPLLPQLAMAFTVSTAGAAWSLSVSTAGLVVAVLPMAVVSERVGRRPVMLGCLALASLLGLVVAFAPAWQTLLVLRFVQGVALAGVPATAFAYAAEVAGPRQAGRMSGLYVAGTTVGGMSGRLLAGAGADAGDWSTGLVVVAVASSGCTAAAWLLLEDVAALPVVPPPVAQPSSVAGSVAALWRQADALQLRLCLLAALLMAAFVAVYTAMTFRLTGPGYRLSPTWVGLVFLAYLGGTASAALAGRMAERWARRDLVVGGIVLLAGGAALSLAQPLAVLLAGLVVVTAGFFAVHGVAGGWAAAAAPPGRGTASARYTIAYYVGATAGGPAGALAWDAGGWGAVVTLVAVLAATSLATAVGLPRQHEDTLRSSRPR